MKKIKMESWDRLQIYSFFKDIDEPRYMITVDIDVTKFLKFVKENHLSFYLSFVFLIMNEMNKIKNFRYRIINHEVFQFEKTHPSFTDSIKGTELFKMVTCNLESDMFQFVEKAKQKSLDQGSTFVDLASEDRFDVVYITSFPWAKYSQVTHAHHIDKEFSIPKLVWGKFENENGKIMMPFSIEVHHGLVDGLHVGKLIQNLQNTLNSY
ncbi:MAG: hypothetical protein JXC31_02825 [Acholeplasmataceae bacterium]|nr:hypothetical protein [Acholeplasmataceae bacterium]